MEYDGAEILGQSCKVKFAEEEHRQILVTNVDKAIKIEELQQYMDEAGPVEYLYMLHEADGPKGSAIVCFKTLAACRNALNYDAADIHGRVVRIYYAANAAPEEKAASTITRRQKQAQNNPNKPPKPQQANNNNNNKKQNYKPKGAAANGKPQGKNTPNRPNKK